MPRSHQALNLKDINPPTGDRPLGRPRRRWENNFRIDFDSAQDMDFWKARMNAALNLRVP